jgi:hypothetical protein
MEEWKYISTILGLSFTPRPLGGWVGHVMAKRTVSSRFCTVPMDRMSVPMKAKHGHEDGTLCSPAEVRKRFEAT